VGRMALAEWDGSSSSLAVFAVETGAHHDSAS
jgi:hypothetical protein